VDLLLCEKISRFGEYLEYLEELANCSLEDYLSDYKIRGASERFMQLAIESIIDMGNEIISVLKLKRAERYRDIPVILAKNRIITEDLAEEIAQMIGFRNILVHDYASIDIRLEHMFLQTRLVDFYEFREQIIEWLKTEPLKDEG
jgi:uncharacterized protein YutE (UPF0331/DUF86 family)